MKSRLSNISTCSALLTICFSYELREAIKSNPYKIVEDVMRTVDEGNGFVSFIDEYSWYKEWVERYCNLVIVDVSCLSRKF